MNQNFLKFIGFAAATVLFSACASQDYKPAESFQNTSPTFLVIGHRGAAAYAPENTIPSFEKALALGVKDVELDVQLTKDGQLILFHDAELNKKTKGKGKVREHTLAELKKLEIGTWFDKERPQTEIFSGTKLPLLSEVFDKFGNKFFYHIEIKADDPEIPAKILELLKKKNLYSSALITSFMKDQLVRTRMLDKKITLCYLIEEESPETIRVEIRDARDLGFQQVAINAKDMLLAHVLEANKAGLWIRGMGIKSREDFDKVVEIGASGTTSDWPDWKPLAQQPKKKK